jgi:hypothetical protein
MRTYLGYTLELYLRFDLLALLMLAERPKGLFSDFAAQRGAVLATTTPAVSGGPDIANRSSRPHLGVKAVAAGLD